MATITNEIALDARAEDVWDAVHDFNAVHRRVAPGFVNACKPDGDARVVTFSNGTIAREILVSSDDAKRRLVYAVLANERLQHYSAAVQIFADGDRRCRLVWTIDLLPNTLADYVRSQVALALTTMKTTLEGAGR